jgi:ribosomal protein S18 acetylase RimI-like enzyme
MDAREPAARQYALGALARQEAGLTDFLVAEFGGVIVGSGELTTTDPAEFKSLSVDASARGQGVGSAIIAAAERVVEERADRATGRARHLVVGVGVDNPRAAALYERLGFVRTGVVSTTTYEYVDDEGATRTATETDEELIRVW